MTVRINASSDGLTETVDTSGILEFQTANTSALVIDTSQNANFTSTGAIVVPVGTTATRPSAANGMIRYNSNSAAFEVYANNSWATANVTPAPTVVSAPVISGSPVVGNNLTCTTGTWNNNPTGYFYQWLANSTAISANATANVFTLTSTQLGANITCNVTAFNAAGNSTPSTSNSLGPVVAGYFLNNSLRFRSSATAFLNRTPASASNRKTWTWSGWVKLGTLGAERYLFTCDNGNDDSNEFNIILNSNNVIQIGGGQTNWRITTQVFRDPSAWYHLVFAIDTTQATAANRIRVYVNGSEVTAFSTNNNPSQNADLAINQAAAHNIGRRLDNTFYFDGYLAEVNFIDGQALTPSSFGESNTNTGVWQPKAYTGTYGTNGFYLPFRGSSTSSFAGSFNGSSQFLYLGGQNNFAFGSGDFTVEMWINPTSTSAGVLYDSRPTSTNGFYPMMYFDTNVLYYYVNGNNEITVSGIRTGVWTHIALVKNSGSTRIYVNGVQAGGTYTDGNTYLNGADRPMIGRGGFSSTGFVNGFISNLRVVKGTAVYTSTFTPPSAPLTAITNTQLLTLQNSTIVDNSTNAFTITNSGSVTTSVQYPFTLNIAGDASGNNNNWTPNNISLAAGVTYDSMTDVPTLTNATTANYATFNPVGNGGGTISNGNLRSSTSSVTPDVGTFAMTTGKWYWETTVTTASNPRVGVYDIGSAAPSNLGANAFGWAIINSPSRLYYNGSTTNYGSFNGSNGDVVMVAYDADAGRLWFGANGSWFASGNPATNANPSFTGVTGKAIVPAVASGTGSNVFDLNCGQQPLTYTPPSGFLALNTFNLPTPTIGATASTLANKYMDATLYTGNGSTLSVINAGGFQPDLVWYKGRSTAYNNRLFDTVRGATNSLSSNLTDAESSISGVTAFNSNGFTLGSEVGGNNNGSTYVAWQWNGGGSNATNTSGTITSTVRANSTAGFSIVSYTGTGANATVGHGLGIAPSMIIVRNRSIQQNFIIGHTSLWDSNLNSFLLFTSSATSTNSAIWNGARPTSSVISIGSDSGTNGNGNSHIAWCWAQIAGFSQFGIFTGNGTTDNIFTYTGFRPEFVMIKATTGTDNWFTLDAARNPFNVANSWLSPNLANAEGSDPFFDLLSNGFKMRLAGNTPYIYMAFAESPFKYALAR